MKMTSLNTLALGICCDLRLSVEVRKVTKPPSVLNYLLLSKSRHNCLFLS